MGTHPIFESDFDCLTECQNKSQLLHFSQSNHQKNANRRFLMKSQRKLLVLIRENRQLCQKRKLMSSKKNQKFPTLKWTRNISRNLISLIRFAYLDILKW